MIQFKSNTERNEWGRLALPVQLSGYLFGLVYTGSTGLPLVITSVVSGPHAANGLHPLGRAIDMRSKEAPPEMAQKFFDFVKWWAGLWGGLALWEDRGTANEHWHFGL